MPKTKTLKVEEFGLRNQVSEEFLRQCDLPLVENLIRLELRRDAENKGYRVLSEITVTWDARSFKYIDNFDGVFDCESTDEGAWRYVYARAEVVKNA